jgi:ethanolamine utilization cobalamin adenosyltransferase
MENKKYHFDLQEKVTKWKSTQFSVDAKSFEEAKSTALQMIKDGQTESIPWEDVENTVEEKMTVEENSNQATLELFVEAGNELSEFSGNVKVYDNTKEIPENDDLINEVIEQIIKDYQGGDTEATTQLLCFLPTNYLINFLPEEKWKKYKHTS